MRIKVLGICTVLCCANLAWAGTEAPVFLYRSQDVENRQYVYQLESGACEQDTILEKYEVQPSEYKSLMAYKGMFSRSLEWWDSDDVSMVLTPPYTFSVIDKPNKSFLREFFLYRVNARETRLVFPSGKRITLTDRSAEMVVKETTTPKEHSIVKKLGDIKLSWQALVSHSEIAMNELKVDKNDLVKPEMITDVYTATNCTVNILVEKSNVGTNYIFIKTGAAYTLTSEPDIVQNGKDLMIRLNKSMWKLSLVPKNELRAYYYLRDRDVNKTADLSDLLIIKLLFPEKTAPSIDADIIYPLGYEEPADICQYRETVLTDMTPTVNALPIGSIVGFIGIQHSPFPHPSRANGNYYQGQFYDARTSYSEQRVGIYIPAHFDRKKPFYFMVYLHGWNNSISNVLFTEKLIDQIELSKKNVMLIIPELAKNAQDSSGGNLDDENGLALMMQDVKQKLTQLLGYPKPFLNTGRVILTAHSGGYNPMANCLMHGGQPVSHAWLFDGLYWHRDRFLLWKKANPQSQLIILNTDTGGTSREVAQLEKTVKGFQVTQNLLTLTLPKASNSYKLRTRISNSDIVIVDTRNTSHHNVVSNGYLTMFLKALPDNF